MGKLIRANRPGESIPSGSGITARARAYHGHD
ncbi:hypothetical protein LTSERUB_0530, partial [Salmonella enterica subsp. enterica serovar Rubislaw str. A4-653]